MLKWKRTVNWPLDACLKRWSTATQSVPKDGSLCDASALCRLSSASMCSQ